MWTSDEPEGAQEYVFKAKRSTWYESLEKAEQQPEQYSEFVDDDEPGEDDKEKMPRSKRTWIILGSLAALLVVLIATIAGTYAHYQGLATKGGLLAAQNSPVPSSTTIVVSASTTQAAPPTVQAVAASIVLDTISQAPSSVIPDLQPLPTTSTVDPPPTPSPSTTTSSSPQAPKVKPSGFVTSQLPSSTFTPPSVPKSTPSPSPSSSPTPSTSSANPIAPASSSAAAAVTPILAGGSTYMTQTYNGVATHFPGSQLATSALACGDSYTTPATTYFAALCKSTFDSFPGTTPTSIVNSNKSPACGAYVAGRKGLTGNWLVQGDGQNWATVGGDGQLSCVGTEAVRCHIPRTITITHGSTTVSNVMIVDRNQGLGASPCAPGDVDVSDAVYRILAKTTTADANAGLGIQVQGVSWRWD